MKGIKTGLLLSLLLWMALALPTAGVAAAITAASVALQDVSAAVAQASTGDTVYIPTGTATWSSRLNITKAINLIGAGTNNTVIKNGAGILLLWQPEADNALRLSGITFNSSDANSYVVIINGPARAARVDHCRFNKGDKPLVFNQDYAGVSVGRGPVYGVVDHCSFYNCARAMFVCDQEEGDYNYGTADWTRPVLPGTTNMMVVENCLVELNSEYTSSVSDPTSIYGQGGGRRCFRYNTFRGASGYIDAHGDNPDYSVVFYEVYRNTFTAGSHGPQDRSLQANIRGGMAIYHDNVFTDSFGSVIGLVHYWPTDIHTVTNFFWWNNTHNGSTNQASMVTVVDNANCPGCSTATIHQDQQYWLHAPQPGNNFYPYTPLVYPHPLVSRNVGPTNPIIYLEPTSLNFGSVAIGSTNDLRLTVVNVGGNKLAGVIILPPPFSIVGESAYSLESNAAKFITVRFAPTNVVSTNVTIIFTGGGGAKATLSGRTS